MRRPYWSGPSGGGSSNHCWRDEMAGEPIARETRDGFEGAGLLEEMRCIRNDGELPGRLELSKCTLVELNNALVGAADDQHRGSLHARECLGSKIWTSSARDDGANDARSCGRSLQCGGGSCACPEIAERERRHWALLKDPICRVIQSLCEQRD